MEIQWSLVLFTVLSGCGAWLFACVGLSEFRPGVKRVQFPASIAAVVLLAVGGIASATHLSHVDRIFAALSHPAPGIFLEALLLGILAVVIIVYAVLFKRGISPAARKVLAVTGMLLTLAFTYACGSSYMMPARGLWDTFALPLAYIGTAAASGTAAYLLLCTLCKEDETALSAAGLYTVIGGALACLLSLTYGITTGIAWGGSAALFWGVVIVCGGIAPIVCGLLAMKKPSNALTLSVIAFAGALAGSIALRALMWLVGVAFVDYFEMLL